MGHTEIERKFLVTDDRYRTDAYTALQITQGYLCSSPERSVRVRLCGRRGFLTIKGPGNATGISRYEWERELPESETRELLAHCEPGMIDKSRHLVLVGAHTFEVDEFHGQNQGLVIAEVELDSEEEFFERPAWLGIEVTSDPRYYNTALSQHPFTTWQK